MLFKKRKTPLRLLKEEALLRNISHDSPARADIQNDCSRRKAGHWGEKELDYYLKLLPDEEYVILNDLRLPFKEDFFQIDSLLLTRRLFYVLESKNMKGTLLFDSKFDQLLRVQGDEEEAFEDPISQAKNHILKLRGLLANQIPQTPFEYLISIASPKTILKSNSEIIPRVSHVYNIVHKLNSLEVHYRNEILTTDQVMDTARFLLELHTPWNNEILTAFGLTHKDFLPGIFCPTCNRKLACKRGNWKCNACGALSPEVYIRKLFDYFLLFRPYISNTEFRNLLEISSGDSSYYLLQKLNLPTTGTGKGKIYLAPCPMEDYEQYIQDLLVKKKRVTII